MAVTATELKQIQREIATLKKKVARLEKRANGKPRPLAPAARTTPVSERERVRAMLRAADLTADLTPEEKALAAEWRALPLAKKRRVQETLWNLKLAKPLSQIVIENR